MLICLLYQAQVQTRDELVEMLLKCMRRTTTSAKKHLRELQDQHRELEEQMLAVFADVIDETIQTPEDNAALGQGVRDIARARAGIDHGSGFPTLRPSFAPPVFEAGVDPHTLQLLLGHRSIKTTLKYVHVSRRHRMHVRSPLDLLCFESANLKALME